MNAKRSFLTLPLAIVATLLAAEGVNAASKSADEPNAIHSIVRGADGSATIISADGSSVSFTAKQIDALKKLDSETSLIFVGNTNCVRSY